MTSPVLVTGGAGRLGRRVVARLVDAGCDVRVLARHQRDTPSPVTFFTGDLRSGEGIDPAVSGVGAIIHCATSTKGDTDATRRLVTAAARTGSPHLVQPSIVGIDRIASWGYTKAKLEVERIVENSGLPWTILRVTQFYDYCFDSNGVTYRGAPAHRSRNTSTLTQEPTEVLGVHRLRNGLAHLLQSARSL